MRRWAGMFLLLRNERRRGVVNPFLPAAKEGGRLASPERGDAEGATDNEFSKLAREELRVHR